MDLGAPYFPLGRILYTQPKRNKQSSVMFIYQLLLSILCVLLLPLTNLTQTTMNLSNLVRLAWSQSINWLTKSEIHNNPPKNGKGLTLWDLVPLGINPIYTTKNKSTVFWYVYISIIVDSHLRTSFSTDKSNENNNELEELGIIDLKKKNVLMMTGEISKTFTLAITSHKTVG